MTRSLTYTQGSVVSVLCRRKSCQDTVQSRRPAAAAAAAAQTRPPPTRAERVDIKQRPFSAPVNHSRAPARPSASIGRPQTAHGCQSVTMATTAAAAVSDADDDASSPAQRRQSISPERTPNASQ